MEAIENKKKLTKSQQRVYDYIALYVRAVGFPPSYREVMTEFNFNSTNSVRMFLKRIQERGHISVIPKIARGIKLL